MVITAGVFDFGKVLYRFDYSRFYRAVEKHSVLSAASI